MKTAILDVNGISISVNETGVGENVILFLHGNSLSSGLFSAQMKSNLASKYRLISFDFQGHGNSSKPVNPEWAYSAEGFGAVVGTILATYKISSFIICGHSFGGHLAIQASLMLGPVLKGLFCVGTPPIGLPPQIDKMYLPNPALMLAYKPDLSDEEIGLLAQNFAKDDTIRELIKSNIKNTDPNFRSLLGMALMAGQVANEKAIVEELKIPIAFVAGAEDALLNKEYYKDLASPTLFEHKLQLVSNAGHSPMAENPIEFNTLLEKFCEHCF